ncbi:MAG: hypothetical protein SGCHY_000729 [Lobulomycetales sp.]
MLGLGLIVCIFRVGATPVNPPADASLNYLQRLSRDQSLPDISEHTIPDLTAGPPFASAGLANSASADPFTDIDNDMLDVFSETLAAEGSFTGGRVVNPVSHNTQYHASSHQVSPDRQYHASLHRKISEKSSSSPVEQSGRITDIHFYPIFQATTLTDLWSEYENGWEGQPPLRQLLEEYLTDKESSTLSPDPAKRFTILSELTLRCAIHMESMHAMEKKGVSSALELERVLSEMDKRRKQGGFGGDTGLYFWARFLEQNPDSQLNIARARQKAARAGNAMHE